MFVAHILSSTGAFQTPQLLELSGIGNPEILARYGIDVVVNLPSVGENLGGNLLISFVCVLTFSFPKYRGSRGHDISSFWFAD